MEDHKSFGTATKAHAYSLSDHREKSLVGIGEICWEVGGTISSRPAVCVCARSIWRNAQTLSDRAKVRTHESQRSSRKLRTEDSSSRVVGVMSLPLNPCNLYKDMLVV
jgi:hypothetical protein